MVLVSQMGETIGQRGIASADYYHRWEQGAYQAVSFFVPDNWQAGRIWVSVSSWVGDRAHFFPSQARRDCDFSNGATGPNTCADGGCNGGLVCTGTVGHSPHRASMTRTLTSSFHCPYPGRPTCNAGRIHTGCEGR